MKKIRLLPAFVTLLAGAITSVALYFTRVETYLMLLILLAVLVIFYVLGVIAMKIIMEMPEKEQLDGDSGEVIQKTDEQADDKKDNSEAKSTKE